MKVLKKSVIAVLAAAALMAGATSHLSAAIPTIGYSYVGDSGTLLIAPNPAGAITPSESTLASPYGTSAITSPVITPLAGGNGWVLSFTVGSNFFASANNHGGSGETTTMTGKLDFDLNFSAPVNLTTNIVENGIYNIVGGSGNTVSVSGGTVIVAPVNAFPNETVPSGDLGDAAVFNPLNKSWATFLQVGGFQHSYSSYSFSIDNDLMAESLASSTLGSALICKKTFTLVITTDGSSGGAGPPTPEPASLGLFAVGSLLLLKRRRA